MIEKSIFVREKKFIAKPRVHYIRDYLRHNEFKFLLDLRSLFVKFILNLINFKEKL